MYVIKTGIATIKKIMFQGKNKTILFVLSIIVLLLSTQGCGGSGAKPSNEQVKKPIKTYLKKQHKCSGDITVDKLIITKVGDYDKNFEGWPVYAIFDVNCQEGGISTTWKGDGSDKAMTAVIRRGLGGYEAFMPKIFEDGFRKLEGMTQDLNQKMKSDWDKAFNRQ